ARSTRKIADLRIWAGDSSPWWTARHRSGCSWRFGDPTWRVLFLLLIAVWVADESAKVRPGDPPGTQPPRVRLTAAGGECAGAQIVVRGPAQALSAASGLAVDLYRVATISLQHPSGPDGAAGEWPDALIP